MSALSVTIKARLETVPSFKALLASADWHPCQQMRDLGHDSCMQGSEQSAMGGLAQLMPKIDSANPLVGICVMQTAWQFYSLNNSMGPGLPCQVPGRQGVPALSAKMRVQLLRNCFFWGP